jgi:hypothetical protein
MSSTFSQAVTCDSCACTEFIGPANGQFCSACGHAKQEHGRVCPRCGTRKAVDLTSCGCGFPIAGSVPHAGPSAMSVDAGSPSPVLPTFNAQPQPSNGALIISFVIAGLISFAVWLVSLGVFGLIFFTGGGEVSNGAIAGFIVLGLISLVACTIWQVRLSISQMEKRAGFTIDFSTEFWILMAALVAELMTSFIAPLNLGVFILVQWWLTKDRAVQLRAPA